MGIESSKGRIEKKEGSFEETFAKRETIDVGDGGTVEVVDVPAAMPTDKEPIFFNPSYLVPINVYKYVIRDFAKSGRQTMSMNYARRGGSLDVPPEDQAFMSTFPTEQRRQALELVQVLNAKHVEETAIVGHSQGGATAAIATVLMARREKRGVGKNPVRNIVFFESAGLIGQDNPIRLAKGMASDPSTQGKWGKSMDALPVSEEERAHSKAQGGYIPEYTAIAETPEDKEGGAAVQGEQLAYLKQNLWRAGAEGWGLSQIQIHSLLRELKEEHGVGVLVISDVDSSLFPTERLAGTRDKKTGDVVPGTLSAADLDGFLSFRGDHALRVPQVPFIEGWLSALENKKRRAVEVTTPK